MRGNLPQDLAALLLVGAASLGIPDLSRAEGAAAATLAGLLAVASLPLLLGRPAAAWQPGLVLAGVALLVVQPFAAPPQEAAPLPTRALGILGVALLLWTQMNVQSVSGRLAWSFRAMDAGLLGACGWVVFTSLALLWVRGEAGAVLPAVLLQALALCLGVIYLFLTRWRPGRRMLAAASLVLAAILAVGWWTASSRAASLERRWGEAQARWVVQAPAAHEVEEVAAEARRVARRRAGDVLAEAARATLRAGRPGSAALWAERATRAAPDASLAGLARLEAALATGDPERIESAVEAFRRRSRGQAVPPATPLPPAATAARLLAADLLDLGRPEEALAWVAAGAQESPGRSDLERLRMEALLALGRPAEAEAAARSLLARNPADVEPLLGLARARLELGDPPGCASAVAGAAMAGAPAPLVLPLQASAACGGAEAVAARRALQDGIPVIPRDAWPDLHPNGNFLLSEAEDRRFHLALVPGVAYRLQVEARGEAARGVHPLLEISAGGKILAEIRVASEDWEWYSVRLEPGASGQALRLRFRNDLALPGGEDRNLVVGEVRLALWSAS